MNLTFDLLSQKWYARNCQLLSCICGTSEANPSNMHEVTESTHKNFQTARVTLTFDPEMVLDTKSTYGLNLYHVLSEAIKYACSYGADTMKTSRDSRDPDIRGSKPFYYPVLFTQ